MATQRERSRQEWTSGKTMEEINSGSFQRIADATEKMALNYQALINERDRYKKWWEDRGNSIALLKRQIAGLKGYINRLKKTYCE